jgi:hypothetical protein
MRSGRCYPRRSDENFGPCSCRLALSRNSNAARVTLDFTRLGSSKRASVAWPKVALGRARRTRTAQNANLELHPRYVLKNGLDIKPFYRD